MTNAPTLVDQSGAYDATVDSMPGRDQAVTLESGTVRTTVLPQVEHTGDAVTLVRSARPRFQEKRALGEGGIGEVVAAYDQDIGREVAIKRLRAGMQGPTSIARFVDEIRTVGALEHPNIVPIHDVGVNDDGSLYFVMRCVQGQTLESIIEKLAAGDALAHEQWTFERRVHVFRQLLDAVAFAHERGFVHRDIKPANVMVGAYGEVFLMDWGIAKPVGANDAPVTSSAQVPALTTGRVTSTHAGAIVGTPAYMSPEQARGEPVDGRSDVYSLSVVFHEWLGLRHYLHDAKTMEAVLHGVQHGHAPFASFVPSPYQSPAPADLAHFVKKGLAKEPSQRYQSVREMIDRLDAREEGLVPIQCPVTLTKRTTHEWLRFVDRHPAIVTAMVVLAVLGSVGATVWHFVRG